MEGEEKMTKLLEERLSKGLRYVKDLEKDSKITIVAHRDGDGMISASIISKLLDEEELTKQSYLFLLKRGEEAKRMILDKVDEENSDVVVFLDYTPTQDTYEELEDKELLTIDHHPGKEASKTGLYINPWEEEVLPSASVMCHILYEQADGDKDTKPWALMGAYADTRLEESEEYLEFTEEERELYLPSRRLNWNLLDIIELLGAPYLDSSVVDRAFDLIRRSIKENNLLLIEEEKYDDAKGLLKLVERAEKEKIKEIKNSEIYKDEESKLVALKIKPELRIKRAVASHLRTNYPGYTIVVSIEKPERYAMSLRSSIHNLSKVVPNACEGIEANGGGHQKAAGATVKKEHYEKFLENLSREIK